MQLALELAVSVFSIATGCLSAVCMAHQVTVGTSLTLVSSFIMALIQVFRALSTSRVSAVVSLIGGMFYLASGLVFILLDLVANKFQTTLTFPLVVVFAVNIVTWGISVPICDKLHRSLSQDSEKIIESNTSEPDSDHNLQVDVPDISKKISEKTLVHGPGYSNNSSESTFSQFLAHYVKSEQLAEFEKKVKRSKSTPALSKSTPELGYTPALLSKASRRSKKSIENEKVFLRCVSQSLLPSVLKQGESPILMVKRQQMKPDIDSGTHSDQASINLPYIDEFEEDHVHFPGFDQAELTSEQAEKYMNGLAIPQSRSQPVLWNLETRNVSGGQVNHISHESWNPQAFLEHRSRSGGNLTIGGSRYVGSKLRNNSSATLALDDTDATFLLPSHISNIDSLSDLSSARPTLYRSMSAPSLHTFRNVSNGSEVPSIPENPTVGKFDFGTVDLARVCTPTTPQEATSESPLRRFIKDSPKRITSVFKKKSMDLGTLPSHKHSTSVISQQYSMASSKSSPRKSIKSLFSGNAAGMQTHRTQGSVPVFSLPVLVARSAEPIDFWDVSTAPSSGGPSRVSSVPSDVIGAYDREKWRTLKLRNDDTGMLYGIGVDNF